jgi:hypothetical protein
MLAWLKSLFSFKPVVVGEPGCGSCKCNTTDSVKDVASVEASVEASVDTPAKKPRKPRAPKAPVAK